MCRIFYAVLFSSAMIELLLNAVTIKLLKQKILSIIFFYTEEGKQKKYIKYISKLCWFKIMLIYIKI